MKEVLVSIIIPTYNQASLVEKAIGSALEQTYGNKEIVVSDDCSTDDTETRVRHLLKTHPEVKYFKHLQNVGRVKNYNYALSTLATGKYVVCLDGDDFFSNANFIAHAVKQMEANEAQNLFVVWKYKKWLTWKQTNTPADFNTSKQSITVTAIEYLRRIHVYGFGHLAILYNRALANEIGFYTAHISSSDMDSFFRLCLSFPEKKVIVHDEIAGVWVKHANNTSSQIKNIRAYLESSWGLYYSVIKNPIAKQNKIGVGWWIRQSVKPTIALLLRLLGFRF
jgi:glycosyltransferase involved in cell wall biosynthesis